MVVKGIGLDSLEISRMQQAVNCYGKRLRNKVFTVEEWDYCLERARPAASLAARFAAKEAVVKVLGADWSRLRWREIEVVSRQGRPFVRLQGRTAGLAEDEGIKTWHLSLTHDATRAMAVVLAE